MNRLAKHLVPAAAALLFAAAAHAETFSKPGFYSIDVTGWRHQPGPSGEIFACTDCDTDVQVQIDYGSALPADSDYKTNREFLQRLADEDAQRQFAELLLRAEIPEAAGVEFAIQKVGMTQLGGTDAFEYSALVATQPAATRENAVVAIHKNRIMKLTLNYFDARINDKATARIAALLKSLKFS